MMRHPSHAARARRFVIALCLLSLFAIVRSMPGQAIATVTGGETSLSAGATFSQYQMDYGKRALGGYAIHADWDRTRRWGVEFEARVLRLNQEVGTHETTFLVGPRYILRRKVFSPYAKLLLGDGKFHYPYNYAEGSYFVLAPGAGVEVRMGESRYSIRLVDFEYQSWPNFSFNGLNPYGVSGGLSVRIF
jgi:hypothetical protein